jgi:mRNA-degrading endonuclease RelE of RelBE toxin-antitoxin system
MQEKLPNSDQTQDRNESLVLMPHPFSHPVNPFNPVKIHGQKGLWRIRVGDNRIVYSIHESHRRIDVSIIRHHRDVYRDL